MRFIVDECTGPEVAKWLSQNGYEVFSVFDEARGADDDSIIQKALEGTFSQSAPQMVTIISRSIKERFFLTH